MYYRIRFYKKSTILFSTIFFLGTKNFSSYKLFLFIQESVLSKFRCIIYRGEHVVLQLTISSVNLIEIISVNFVDYQFWFLK